MKRAPWGILADLLLFSLGTAQAWLATRLPNGLGLGLSEPGPGLFPALVGSTLALAAALHLAQNLRRTAVSPSVDEPPADSTPGDSPLSILWLVLVLAGYIVLLPRLGFGLAAFGLLLGTLSIYGMPGHLRRIGTAAAVTGLAYFLFTRGLGVNLPQPTWL